MAGTLTESRPNQDGLRPIHPVTDLSALADLMEIGFGATMDEAGRAVIREMRALGGQPWLALLLSRLDRLLGGFQQGFVWTEDKRLVGNVSVMPAPYPQSLGRGAIIANVVVHPNFQRRGIARALLTAALDLIQRQGRTFALLQVDLNNDGAQRLYSGLGFRQERAFTRWLRPAQLRSPAPLPEMPPITLRAGRDWQAEYELVALVRPAQRGGLGWLRPTYPGAFRPSLWTSSGALLGQSNENWVLYRTPSDPRHPELVAAARLQMAFGSPDKFDLLVHPTAHGTLELPLLNFIVRRLDAHSRPLVTDHPTDDEIMAAVLQQYGFEARRSEINMRLDFGNR